MAGISKVAKTFLKGQADEIGKVGKNVAKGSDNLIKRVTNNVKPGGGINVGGMAKDVLLSDAPRGRALENLYTGKKLNGKLLGGVGALGAAGYIAADNTFGESNLRPNKASDIKSISDISGLMSTKASLEGALPSENPYMIADGSGTANATSSKAQTLNSNGDMVFGLHNMRKGG